MFATSNFKGSPEFFSIQILCIIYYIFLKYFNKNINKKYIIFQRPICVWHGLFDSRTRLHDNFPIQNQVLWFYLVSTVQFFSVIQFSQPAPAASTSAKTTAAAMIYEQNSFCPGPSQLTWLRQLCVSRRQDQMKPYLY